MLLLPPFPNNRVRPILAQSGPAYFRDLLLRAMEALGDVGAEATTEFPLRRFPPERRTASLAIEANGPHPVSAFRSIWWRCPVRDAHASLAAVMLSYPHHRELAALLAILFLVPVAVAVHPEAIGSKPQFVHPAADAPALPERVLNAIHHFASVPLPAFDRTGLGAGEILELHKSSAPAHPHGQAFREELAAHDASPLLRQLQFAR